MKKIILLVILAFCTISVHGVEEIEKLMVEKAESPQEKKAVKDYILSEAKQRKAMAKRLRKMAKTRKGGKAQTQIKHKQEMLEEAETLEKIAKDYEELAKQLH